MADIGRKAGHQTGAEEQHELVDEIEQRIAHERAADSAFERTAFGEIAPEGETGAAELEEPDAAARAVDRDGGRPPLEDRDALERLAAMGGPDLEHRPVRHRKIE